MKNILYISFIIFSFSAYTQAKKEIPAINWMGMQEALDLSDNPDNKKKFFIDVYTDWCKWCDTMDATTFLDSSVIAYINEHYYAVKLDAQTKDTIKYRGVDFINSKAGVTEKKESYHFFVAALLDRKLSYPSYVILDEKHTRLAIYKGHIDAKGIYSILLFFTLNQHQQYTQYLYGEIEKIQKKKNKSPST
jgi:thioredoxin-related protein